MDIIDYLMEKLEVWILIIVFVILVLVCFMLPFGAIDWKTGEHGRLTVTAIDNNLFGTQTVYVRNSESLSGNEALEVQYCIDAGDSDIIKKAKEAIGKQNTTIVYSEKRIGLFWFDKCKTAPITDIHLDEEK